MFPDLRVLPSHPEVDQIMRLKTKIRIDVLKTSEREVVSWNSSQSTIYEIICHSANCESALTAEVLVPPSKVRLDAA